MNYVRDGLTDDSDFLCFLDLLITGLIRRDAPKAFWIIQIDNWFDDKWLGFSGTGAVESGIPWDRFDSVKIEFYKRAATFPPFHPNRILAQWSFVIAGSGYVEAALTPLPHASEKRPGWENIQRSIQVNNVPTFFLWYSANTIRNDKASVMVYEFGLGEPVCWFASFEHRELWSLGATKATSRERVLQLINAGKDFSLN